MIILLPPLVAYHEKQGKQDCMENKSPLSPATRLEVIEGLLSTIRKHYVFPTIAEEIEASIHQRLQDGEYETITTAELLAHQLTTSMQEISKDKHLHLFSTPEELPDHTDQEGPAPKWWDEKWPFQNFGFEKVERLPGNIGYLDVRAFYPPEAAGDVAIAAMNFLANTSALIIDLRKNGGGDPAMVALICSYFFESEPVHLNSLYWRASDSTQQFWTLPYVPGKRYLGKPVYLLTSRNTFSGAEEF